MKILLVQPYYDGKNKYNYHKIYDKIVDIISEHPVDLIVFPEGFIHGSDDINDCFETTRCISDFSTPRVGWSFLRFWHGRSLFL